MKVIINITTYNRADMLMELLEDIAREFKSVDYKIKIYNDSSTENYNKIIEFLNKLPGQHYYKRLSENLGKKGYWKLHNIMYDELKKEKFDYYIQMQDDQRLVSGFYPKAINYLKQANVGALNILTVQEHQESYSRRKLQQKIINGVKYWNIQFLDCNFITTPDFFKKIDWSMPAIPESRWKRNPNISSGVGGTITKKYTNRGGTCLHLASTLLIHNGQESVMNTHKRITQPCYTYLESATEEDLKKIVHRDKINITPVLDNTDKNTNDNNTKKERTVKDKNYWEAKRREDLRAIVKRNKYLNRQPVKHNRNNNPQKLNINGIPENKAKPFRPHKHITTNNIKLKVYYDVIIIIPSKDRFNFVINILNKIKSKSNYTYRIIVLNDASNDKRYSNLLNYDIDYLENTTNYGKYRYWETINKLLTHAQYNYEFKWLIQLDDDFELCDNFLDKVIDEYVIAKQNNNKIRAFHLFHTPDYNLTRWNMTTWIDGGGLYEYELLKEIQFKINPISIHRWDKYKNLSSGVWQQISRKIISSGGVIFKNNKSYINHLGFCESKMHPEYRKKVNI